MGQNRPHLGGAACGNHHLGQKRAQAGVIGAMFDGHDKDRLGGGEIFFAKGDARLDLGTMWGGDEWRHQRQNPTCRADLAKAQGILDHQIDRVGPPGLRRRNLLRHGQGGGQIAAQKMRPAQGARRHRAKRITGRIDVFGNRRKM